MDNTDLARAYNYIRERILSGEYRSEQPLRPDLLAPEIGLSRTPVREALRQLDADGLVTIRPRYGACVRAIDLDEFGELCGLRMALEMYAAGMAARLRTNVELAEIALAHEAAANEVERMIASVGPDALIVPMASEAMLREEVRFHMTITNAAKNRTIKKEIMRHQLITRIVSRRAQPHSGLPMPANHRESVALMRATVTEHAEIYQAIKNGDAAGARNAMERHLQEDMDTMLRRMARDEQRQLAEVR